MSAKVSRRIRYSRDVDSTSDTNATTPANSPQPLHFSQELRASPDLLLDLDRLAFFFRLDFNLTPPAICPQNLCQSTYVISSPRCLPPSCPLSPPSSSRGFCALSLFHVRRTIRPNTAHCSVAVSSNFNIASNSRHLHLSSSFLSTFDLHPSFFSKPTTT